MSTDSMTSFLGQLCERQSKELDGSSPRMAVITAAGILNGVLINFSPEGFVLKMSGAHAYVRSENVIAVIGGTTAIRTETGIINSVG